MLVWLIVPFYDFCGFWSVAVNSVYKLQFFTYILYLLLYSQIYAGYLVIHSVQGMFLKMNTRHQAHKPVKKCNYCGRFSKWNCQTGQTASACQFRGDRSNRCRDMAIFDFWRWRPPPCWIFEIWNFLTVGRLKRVELHRHAKFDRNRSNRGRDLAIFRFFELPFVYMNLILVTHSLSQAVTNW